MTKKFTINCDFGGQMSPFAIFVGKPEKGHHPLHFQADWLSKARGGTIPSEVMEAVTQLQELAEKNGVALEDLCVYALGTEKQQSELEGGSGEDLEESPVAESENSFVGSVDSDMVEEVSNQGEASTTQEFTGEQNEEAVVQEEELIQESAEENKNN